MPKITLRLHPQFLTRWYVRSFKVITIQRAKQLGLQPFFNLPESRTMDMLVSSKFRSFWVDEKDRVYRVNAPIDWSEDLGARVVIDYGSVESVSVKCLLYNGTRYIEGDEWPIPDNLFTVTQLPNQYVRVSIKIELPEIGCEGLSVDDLFSIRKYTTEDDFETQIKASKKFIKQTVVHVLLAKRIAWNGRIYHIDLSRLSEMNFILGGRW